MEQNVFLTKMIGVVVAFVVLAVVLVPICDSLTDSNGGGNGGESDSDEPGEVYHNTGDMKYSKVTSATNVTIYPYYDEDANEYGFSFQDPAVHPESIVTVSVGERDISNIFGLDWGASLSTFPVEIDGNRTQIGVWELWGKVGELAENPDAEIYYFGTISIVNGNATFDGFKSVWVDSQEMSTPVEFALPNMMYSPDPEGSYVCPMMYDAQEDETTYTKIYADETTEIFVVSKFMTISGTIENPVITIIAEGGPPTLSVQFNISGDILTGVIIESGDNPLFTFNTNEGDVSYSSDVPLALSIAPATIGEESSGSSNGDSNGDDLGTTGTLIRTIPIFVALGLIVGIVGMFYQNRKAI